MRPPISSAARLLLAGSLLASVLWSGPTAAQEVEPAAAVSSPPVIMQPADIYAAALDASGADVAFDLPSATDESDGEVAVACAPGSGARFALGQTIVSCLARDDDGNEATTTFSVYVSDLTPPVVTWPGDLVVDTVDGADPVVVYTVAAFDNVDGPLGTTCDIPSGSIYPVGATGVTCTAVDAAGNAAATSFVVVNPPPATSTPVPTAEPTLEPTALPTQTPVATGEPEPTATRTPTPSPSATAKPDATPTPAALDLPWPPPESFTLVGDGGTLDGLAMIWAYGSYPISQEFGHTWFSVRNSKMYGYGRGYGLDGFEHTGLDIGMARGTAIYSPVSGTVKHAGGTPFFTFYGNGQPGVGELLIVTDNGSEVVLGHMGLITVAAGTRVEIGQLVGLSGGDNGDHLHLEVREMQRGGGLRLVDPRRSFIVDVIAKAAADRKAAEKPAAVASSRTSEENRAAKDDDPEQTAP